jgi:hypothetical protein
LFLVQQQQQQQQQQQPVTSTTISDNNVLAYGQNETLSGTTKTKTHRSWNGSLSQQTHIVKQ